MLAGLWSGEPFSFEGEYYQIKDVQFLPPPIQQPRILIWIAGGWPRKRPFRRAARWDGIIPFKHDGPLTPNDYREMVANIRQQRIGGGTLDAVCYVSTVTQDSEVDIDTIADFGEAGVTWWLHGLDMSLSQPLTAVSDRVRKRPPEIR